MVYKHVVLSSSKYRFEIHSRTEYGDVFVRISYILWQKMPAVYKRIWCCHLANRFEIFGMKQFANFVHLSETMSENSLNDVQYKHNVVILRVDLKYLAGQNLAITFFSTFVHFSAKSRIAYGCTNAYGAAIWRMGLQYLA